MTSAIREFCRGGTFRQGTVRLWSITLTDLSCLALPIPFPIFGLAMVVLRCDSLPASSVSYFAYYSGLEPSSAILRSLSRTISPTSYESSLITWLHGIRFYIRGHIRSTLNLLALHWTKTYYDIHRTSERQHLEFPRIWLVHKPLYFMLIYLKTCNWTVCNHIWMDGWLDGNSNGLITTLVSHGCLFDWQG